MAVEVSSFALWLERIAADNGPPWHADALVVHPESAMLALLPPDVL